MGPFLWKERHLAPVVQHHQEAVTALLNLIGLQLRRTIRHSPASMSWVVEDSCIGKDGSATDFSVRWQFAPGTWIKVIDQRRFLISRGDASVEIEVGEAWAKVQLVERESERPADDHPLAGIVSPAFRKTVWAPYLKLVARPAEKPGTFWTRFSTPPV
jgi:hypothetical protein